MGFCPIEELPIRLKEQIAELEELKKICRHHRPGTYVTEALGE